MSRRCIVLFQAAAAIAPAQEYVIDTIAGGAVPPEQVAAVDVGIGAPQGVTLDAAGNFYFTSLNCVFKVDALGLLTRVAGNGRRGYSGVSIGRYIPTSVDCSYNMIVASH